MMLYYLLSEYLVFEWVKFGIKYENDVRGGIKFELWKVCVGGGGERDVRNVIYLIFLYYMRRSIESCC